MKTYNTVAIQTDINGVDSNEELTALFTRALQLCQTTKPSQATHRSSLSSTQYLSSKNVTDCLQEAESVELPLPEIDFNEFLESVQAVCIQMKEEGETEMDEGVETADKSVDSRRNEEESASHVYETTQVSSEHEIKCSVCTEMCISQEAWNKHMKTHGEGNKVSQDSSHLTHVRSNTNEIEHLLDKPYKCSLSDNTFLTRGGLKKHTKESQHKCKYKNCDKGFFSKILKHHYETHTGEKTHIKCMHCDKAFRNKHTLKEHFQLHTGETPYECECCNKTFVSKARLKQHVQIHTGERPHQCKYCDKAFLTKGNLKQHYRTHTRERPW